MTTKGPWKIKLHLGEHFYNMVGEDKFYSLSCSKGNLVASHICEESDAKLISLVPEMKSALLQLKKLNNPEVEKIIGQITKLISDEDLKVNNLFSGL